MSRSKKNEIISNKKKLMLVCFLVPILTDFRSIFKSIIKNYYPFQCFSCNLYPICVGLCWAQSEFKLDYYFNCLNSKFIVKQEIKKYLSKGAKK